MVRPPTIVRAAELRRTTVGGGSPPRTIPPCRWTPAGRRDLWPEWRLNVLGREPTTPGRASPGACYGRGIGCRARVSLARPEPSEAPLCVSRKLSASALKLDRSEGAATTTSARAPVDGPARRRSGARSSGSRPASAPHAHAPARRRRCSPRPARARCRPDHPGRCSSPVYCSRSLMPYGNGKRRHLACLGLLGRRHDAGRRVHRGNGGRSSG